MSHKTVQEKKRRSVGDRKLQLVINRSESGNEFRENELFENFFSKNFRNGFVFCYGTKGL